MLDPEQTVHCHISHLYADIFDPVCRSRYLRLTIHPTVDDLREHAVRHSKRTGRADDHDSIAEAEGLWQPARFRSRYDRRTRTWIDTTPPFAGVMRLARPRLTAEVIAHESTHAALTITRLHDWSKDDHDGRADFGEDCDDHEEAFAYLLGDIVRAVTEIVEQVASRGWMTGTDIPPGD